MIVIMMTLVVTVTKIVAMIIIAIISEVKLMIITINFVIVFQNSIQQTRALAFEVTFYIKSSNRMRETFKPRMNFQTLVTHKDRSGLLYD